MTAAVRLWVSLRGNVQSISDPVLNDTQSVRAHKQMRSMVEVAFLNRCERGKNHNNRIGVWKFDLFKWHGKHRKP